MKLYSYQENVLSAIRSDPSHSQLISMPTGTGKTITFLAAIKDQNKKCLILVHRQELLTQTYEKAILLGFKKSEISLINSEEKQGMKTISIAMVPTLIRNLHLYKPEDIEMMVIDEAHHALAASYKSIISHFLIFEEKKLLLGFTATPLRGDKQALSSIFKSHSFKMTLEEATQNGYICPVHGMRVDIDRSLSEIEMAQGDYDVAQLDKIMNCESINNLVADKCEHLKKTPALVFCTSVDHAINISKLLRKKKRKAISVSYLTPKKTLEKIFHKLKNGQIEFITNAVKLSEGFDYPPIESIIITRPTRSPVLYKQIIGRGLRKSPNKHDCFVLEFSGTDSSMVCWEDIDKNCTFQTSTKLEEKTKEEAILFYKGKFQSPNVKILQVRMSPFKFYECNISRLIKYGKFHYYIPFEMGFTVFELLPDKDNGKYDRDEYGLYSWMCFWKDKYKTFYVWSAYECSQGKKTGLANTLNWINNFRFRNNQNKWYPSEEEPMTHMQKNLLIRKENWSARKAEMFIEDSAIKLALRRYFIESKIDNIKEDSHSNKIHELNEKY